MDQSNDGDGANLNGQQRRNETHQSQTDPEAKLYCKGSGQEARLSYLRHVSVENRNGLIVNAMATAADGHAERDAALLMMHHRWRRGRCIDTMAADKGFDSQDFVKTMRAMQLRSHVMQNDRHRRSAI